MKIFKTVLSQFLVIFNLIPSSTKRAIVIYLLKKAAESTKTDIDNKFVDKVEKSWK